MNFLFYFLITTLNSPLDARLPGLRFAFQEQRLTEKSAKDFNWIRYSFNYSGRHRSYIEVFASSFGFYTPNQKKIKEGHIIAGLRYDLRISKLLELRGKHLAFNSFWEPPSLPEYDPLLMPDYRLYTFDPEPIIGTKHLFEVRTDEAIVKLNLPRGFIFTGKTPLRIGPGYRGSMLLSAYSQPLTFIYNARFNFSKFKLLAFNAIIPDSFRNRRLSLQRVEFWPNNTLSIGVTEAVLYSYPEDPMKYFNPVDLYYIVQRRGTTNEDNLIATVDISWTTRRGIRFYFEFLNDDFLIIKHPGPSNQPLWGYLTGIHVVKSNLNFRAEFSWVRRWTYAHFSRSNSVLFWGLPLGHWLGNDQRSLYLETSKLTPYETFAVFFELIEHGKGRLSVPNELDPENTKPISTPSGIVDTRTAVGAYFLIRDSFGAFIRTEFIKNYRNSKGDNLTRITLGWWMSGNLLRISFD